MGTTRLTVLVGFMFAMCVTAINTDENVPQLTINGEEVEPLSRPYMAFLYLFNLTKGEHWNCAGGLINEGRNVLTSKSCLDGADVAAIILGAHNVMQNETDQKPVGAIAKRDFHFHPIYDVAVIRLWEPVPKQAYSIRNIGIPKEKHRYPGEGAEVCGWGRKKVLSESTVLKCGTSSIYEPCDGPLECAKGYLVNKEKSCPGDKGSPVVMFGSLVIGVLSQIPEDCTHMNVSSYVRVGEILEWLEVVCN